MKRKLLYPSLLLLLLLSFINERGNAQIISGGYYHSLLVCSSGTLKAFGNNGNGQLGDSTNYGATQPKIINGLSGVIAISGGYYHTIALKSDGTVWTWGYNGYGELGDSTNNSYNYPIQVRALTGIVAVSAGWYSSYALKSDGTVWSWGANWNGQLGNGTYNASNYPIQVTGLSGITKLSAGGYHALALKNDGTVWSWGYNYYGELGDATSNTKPNPVQSSISGITTISAGGYHSLFLKNNGTVWACGYNYYGQIGNITNSTQYSPVQVSNVSGITAICAGGYHSLAIKNNTTVWAWGYNGYGELGDGTTNSRNFAAQISSLTGVTSIAAGFYHTLAIKNDGSFWAIGYNGYGQLGNGTYTDEHTAIQIHDCCSNLPAIGVPISCITMDTTVQTAHSSKVFKIKNTACSSLIVSSIISSNAAFTISPVADTIAAYDSAKITITFSPTILGNNTSTLTIHNNAHDTTICVNGYCAAIPVVSVTPSSLNVTLGCSSSSTSSLVISNTGVGNLSFQTTKQKIKAALMGAEYYALPGLQTTLMATGKFSSIDIYNTATVTPTLAQLKQYDAVMVWSDWGYADYTTLGNNLADYIDGGGGVVTAMWSLANANIGGRFNTSNYWCIDHPGNYISGEATLGTIYSPNSPILQNVSSFDGGGNSYRANATSVDPLATRVSDWSDGTPLIATRSINGTNRVDLNMWPADSWLSSTDGAILMANALSYTANRSGWFTVSASSGTVSAGSTLYDSIHFSSNGLVAGTYTNTIIITSNDPSTPTVNIPCTLNVVGTAQYNISLFNNPHSCIDHDSIMANTTQMDSLSITNIGCDTLKISSMNISNSAYSILSFTSGMIAPGVSKNVLIKFSPPTAGIFSGILTIHSNLADTTVCLNSKAFANPIIGTLPTSLSVALGCSDSTTSTILLINSGGSTLNWNATGISSSNNSNPPTNYCNPTMYPYNGCSYINSVTTSGGITNITTPVDAGYPYGNYSYYTSPFVSQNVGGSFTLTVQAQGNCGVAYFSVWIDWNQNGVFDANEEVVTNVSTGNNITSFIINVPQTATSGATRMRIIDWPCGSPPLPCGNLSGCYGETEDYIVKIPSLVTMTPVSGSIPANSSANLNVNFNSIGYNAGSYSGSFSINSNDPITPILQIPWTLTVTGSPHLQVSLYNTTKPCLDLDSIMAYTISTDSLKITNTGCDTLRINSYSISPSVYSVVSYPTIIPPGISKNLLVKFSPTSAGTFSGTLSLYTNVIDTSICLTGIAFPQPTISTSPSSFNVNLGCSDSLNTSLVINNTGGGALNYSIINPNLPVNPSCRPITTGTCCNMGIYNVTFNTINNTTGNATQGYQDYTSSQSTLIIPGHTYTLSVQTGPNYTEYVSAWIDYNNNGIFEANEQIMNANSNFNVHTVSVTIPANAGVNGAMRMRVGSDYYYSGAPQPCNNLQYGQFEDYTIKTSSSIGESVSSNSGTIGSGSSNTVNVHFSSMGLNVGTYSGNITINNNDPLHNPLVLPYTIHVSGTGTIALTKNCLYMDSIMQYTSKQDSLFIKNIGCDTLKVTNITHQLAAYSVNSTTFNILPGDSAKLKVTFAPTIVGPFNDTLTILNNNVTQKVCLSGKAFARPIISTVPTSFNETLACCDSITLPLAVNNSGGSNLNWSLNKNNNHTLNFNGSNSYVQMNNSTAFDVSQLTIEAWVYSANYNQNGFIFEKGPVNSQYSLFFEGTNLCFRTIAQSGGCGMSYYLNTASIGITNGAWHHIAATFDGSNKRIYVDGVLRGTSSFTCPLVTGQQGEIIGAYGGTGGHSYFYNGDITEVRIWNYARTQAQIAANLYGQINPAQSGLVGYYPLSEGSGTTLYDKTSNSNNGISTNTTWLNISNPVSFPQGFSASTFSGTAAAGGTDTVFVKFKSCGLSVGTYSTNIIVNSNDPLNSNDTVHCTLHVTGAGIISLSRSCMNLDSIMQYTTHKDSMYVKNKGCDTLKITNITTQTSVFTVNPSSFNILPGDSVKVTTTSSPVSTGTFTDTLTILNNNVTQKVCLIGKSFARPIISTNPTSLSATLSCVDSTTSALIMNNTGGSVLNYNINLLNPTMNTNLPSTALCAPATIGTCCNMGIYNVTFGSINNSTGNAVQGYQDYSSTQSTAVIPGQTYSISVQTGTSYPENVRAWIDFNDNGIFEATEMVLNNLNTLPNTIHTGTVTIPTTAVKNKAVRMRVGSEYYYYAAPQPCTNVQYGQFEDYTVKIADWVTLSSLSGSVTPSSSNIVNLNFNSSNLNVGTNTVNISITSNDPLNSPLIVPCSLTVVGAGKISLSKNCMYLDSIMQYTSHKDSLYIKNTGCDTLKITNITNQLSIFTVNATSFNILPGDSTKLYTTFSPVAFGTFLDTLTILNNNTTKKVCLSGKCFQRPIISTTPTSFNVSLSCCDSTILPLTINNTGGSNLICSIKGGGGTTKPKVLIVTAGDAGVNAKNALVSTGKFISSDIDIMVNPSTLTMTMLAPYNAVLVWTNSSFGSSMVGDTLKKYVDNGGGVIIGTYAFNSSWGMTGGIVGPNYSPFIQSSSTQCVSGIINLAALPNPNHPIFKNISVNPTYWTNCNYYNPALSPGATLIASDLSGNKVVAENHNGKVIGMVIYPDYLSSANASTDMMFANALYYLNNNTTWLTYTPNKDTTTAGGSSIVNMKFKSCGLLVGTYNTDVVISSNDPLKPIDSVHCTLHVTGTGVISTNKNCLNLDSIMVYTSYADSSLYIKNTGCDTLKITNITHLLSVYSVSPTSIRILPGDSARVGVTFSPTTVGTFTDTLTILNNNITQKVCLSGKGYPRPVQCHNPNSYNIHFTICQDSIVKPITVCNRNGGSNLLWSLTNSNSRSAVFNGNSAYINNGTVNLPTGSVMTTEAWIYPVSYPDGTYNGIVSWGGRYCNGTAMLLSIQNNGRPSMATWCNDFVPNSGPTAVLNQWNHIACVLNGTSVTLYMNGVPISGTLSYLPNVLSYNLAIGATDYPGRYFNGKIDEVRIYNRALTQAEILTSMTNTLSGNEVGLKGYWNFENGTANDLSPFGNNGTLSGGAYITPTWVNFNPQSGTTTAGGSSTGSVVFYKNGQSPGVHNYSIYVNSNDPLNTVDTIPVTLTIDSIAPAPPVSSNVNVCYGYSVPPFTATGNAGDTIKWYNSSMVLQHVGSTYNTGQTAIGVYTYYVTATDSISGCQSRKDSVQLHINAAPTTPLATDKSACFGSTIPSLTSTGTIQKWYSNSSLTNLLFVGNPYNTGMTAAGTYTYYVADSTAGCPKSTADTVSLTIHSIPSKPIVNNISACFAGTIPSFTATGTGSDTIKWYSSSLAELHIGNTYSTGLTSPGTYTYYVTQTDSLLGCASPKDTATLTIHFTPQPTSNNQTSCFGSSSSTLTATGTNLKWYSSNMTFLYAGNPYNTGLTAVGVDTFYVTQTLNNCESSAKRVILTINPLPAAPTSANVKTCFGQSTPALTATGTNVSWYSNPALTTLAHSGNTYNTGLTAVGNYSFYVTQSALGCNSPADTVHLNIGALPSRPITSNANSCFGNPTPNLVASPTGSDTVKWYSNAALTNLVFKGNPFNTGITAVGTYTYYLTQTDTVSGCVSKSDTVTLSINSAPVKPIANDIIFCFGQPIAPLTSTGTIIHWYSNPSLTTLVYTGNPYNTGNTAVGTYTYYLTDSTVGCPVSPPDTVNLTINPIPAAPTTSGNISICFGQANPLLIATGTNINWYSDAALTTLVHTGSPFTPAQTSAGIYNFYVTQTVNGCSSTASNVVFTIHLTPPVSVSNINVVFGTSVPDFTTIGSNIIWYDSTGILTGTGNTFATGQTAIGQYTYYVTQTLNGCESVKDTVKLTIRPLAPVSSNIAVCFGNTIPDLTTSTGVNINWYSNSGLTNLVHSGSTFATGQTTVGTYTYYVTQTVNGIQSSPTTVTLTINAIPAAPLATNQSACFGGVIPNLTATGSSIQWYSGTSVVSSGSSFATGNTAVGVYPYAVTQTVNGCESPSKADTLTINSLPSKPVASDVSSCFGTSTPDLSATGTNIQWYSTTPSLVGSGSLYATGKTLPGVYTYLVTQTSGSTGCESSYDTVTVTINFTARPVATNVSVCAGTTVPALTATGTNIQWYDSAFAAVHSGSPFNTGQTAIGIHTYYVTQTNSTTGCESLKDTVTLAINALPTAPVSSNATVCFGQSTPSLVATGTNVNWYNSQTLSTVLFNGNNYNTGNTAAGVYTYYLTQTISGCQSPADSVTLTINPTPAAPITSGNVAICFGQANPTLSATGTNINWYSDVTLTTLAGTGSTFTPTQTAAGTYTYYVTQTTNGCVSPASTITFTIHFTPAVHVNNISIPFGTATPDLAAIGTNIIWYDSAMVNVSTNNTFSTGVTAIGAYIYYVTQTLNNCESARDTVVLTIYPSNPVSSNQSNCFGTATPDLSATGNNIRWYSDSLLTHLVYSGNPSATGNTAVGAYNYFVTQTVNNVQSPYTKVTLTINAIPAAPVAVNKSACFGGTVPDLTAAGTTIQWYSASTVVHSGNTFTTGITAAGVYGYTVTQTANGCESAAAADTLAINSLPVTPVATPVTVCFGNPVPALTATGTNIIWHDTTGAVVHNGSPFTTGITSSGTHTFYVYELNTLTGCQSHPDTTTLKINYTAPPIAANVSICRGTTVPPLTATGTNIQWYNNSILLFSGNSFATGDTAVGVYSYYVTQTNSVTNCQSKADTVTLSINTAPAAPTGTNASVCFGGTVPSLTSSGTNVNWYSSAALGTSLFNGNSYNTGMTAVGAYTYYITQTVGGCTGPASTVTLTINSIPAMPSTSGNASICFGQANPTFTATGSNIKWYSNSNLTTLVQSGNSYTSTQTAAGAYTYYVTQNNLTTGCASIPDSLKFIIHALPTVSAGSSSPSVCSGSPVTLIGSGATIYTWSGSVTNGVPFVPASSGTYTVTGTDNNSCTNTSSVSIVVNPLPVLSNTVTAACAGTCNGIASVSMSGGTPGYTYTWGSGFTSSTLTNLCSGIYSVTGTDGNGCQAMTSISVTANPLPLVTASASSASVCAGFTDTLHGGGATSYVWSGGVTNGLSFTPTSTATYTVTGTNNNGCVNTASVTVTVNNLPIIIANTTATSVCNGVPVTLTGSGGTSYAWSSGVTNGVSFVPASTGTYTVTGTDSHGCINTNSVTVSVNSLPTVTANASANIVCSGTSVTLFGGGSTSYSWSGGVTDNVAFVPLSSQTYTVTGNVGSGCSNTSTIFITVNSLPVVTASASSASICAGFTDTLHGGGATSYVWSGGVTNGVSFTPVSTATYTVTGTDHNNCTNTSSVTVTVNNLPTILANTTATAVCNGIPVTLTGSGGTTYSWSSGVTNGVSFAPASTGTYTVTGTDSNGCVNTNSVTVSVNSLPTVTANASASIVCSGTSVTLFGGGATSYSWTGGVTDNVAFVPVSTQTYTVTGTDGNSCSNTSTIFITVNSLPLVTASASSTSICNGFTDTLHGGGATSYVWSGGVTNGVSFAPVSTATYTVTGTDNNSCANTASVTVTVNNLPTIIANTTATVLCNGAPVTLTGSGGTSYVWSGGVNDGVSFAPSSTGTYTVTGTDTHGCININSVTVSVNLLPVVIANASATSICAGSPITLYGSGATSYVWTNGVTDNVSFVPSSGIYTVTGTDGNGCSNTSSVSISIKPLPVVTIHSSASTVCAGTSVILYGSGALSYSWSGGLTDSVPFVPAATATYTVISTGSNGCNHTDSTTVTVNPLPAKPVALDTNVCSLATIPNLTATGTNVHWFNTSNVNVYNGNSFATGQTAVGTYTYYVTQSIVATGCVSPADTSVLVIMTTPPVPVASNVTVCFGNPATTLYSSGTHLSWYSNAGLTNLVHTGNNFNNGQTAVGTYTYYITDSLPGCRSSAADMVTLTINAAPAIPVANNVTVCYGNSDVLSATGISPHWYGDYTLINLLGTGNNFTPPQSGVGNYTYYVVDYTAGCGNSRSDTVHLDINPRPLVTTNISTISVASGTATTLTAYNAATYTWAPATGLNTTSGATVIATPHVTTTYTVTGTNKYGCTNTATVVITVTTGINEVDAALSDLNIYPNPAIDQFTIEFTSSLNTPIEIYLFNSLGQRLWVANPDGVTGQGLKKHKYEVNTNSLDAGVYSIEIVTNQGTLTRRVVLIK